MTEHIQRQRRPRTRAAVFACITAVALVADQLTKALAQTYLAGHRSVRVIPNMLSLPLVHNPGASLANGKVVDFLDYGWSVGNVADIFLMVAGVGIVVTILCNVPFRSTDTTEDGATGESE